MTPRPCIAPPAPVVPVSTLVDALRGAARAFDGYAESRREIAAAALAGRRLAVSEADGHARDVSAAVRRALVLSDDPELDGLLARACAALVASRLDVDAAEAVARELYGYAAAAPQRDTEPMPEEP